MASNDFVMTLDSDGEDAVPKASSTVVSKTKSLGPEEAQLDPDFDFNITEEAYDSVLAGNSGYLHDEVKTGSRPEPISVDDIIARRRLTSQAFKRKRAPSVDDSESEGDDDKEDDKGEGAEDSTGSQDQSSDEEFGSLEGAPPEADSEAMSNVDDDPLATSDENDADLSQSDAGDGAEGAEHASDDGPSSSDESEPETQAERDRKAAFFDSETKTSEVHSSFLTMNLSRPILKAVTSVGFLKPTPIQAATVPVALLGKDVVGGAVTGSGKTAAFIIPMLERLLFRDKGKKAAATRCLVLVPTRELAAQCFEVGSKLAAYTDVRFCLVVGGLSLKAQEIALRARPDVVIATPGRLIDHVRNSPSFTLDALDILVLDEADRMLSEGFADELTEIVKSCPTSRQTMLFSATMTDSVDELVRMSLNRPVRLFVDPKRSTARGLVQEFVRVRAGKEAERSALLVALCKRTFKTGVIIFLRSKKLAHQMRVVFSLLDMKCEELHGDLSQEQRLKALQVFRDGAVDFLMATDLASRGLDIKGIETVINYDMPGDLAQYLHRVGRTARAGKVGRSVTLVGESDRKMLKAAIKRSAGEDQVRHRTIPPEAVSKWVEKLDELKDEISGILQEEKEEKEIRKAEMELTKGQNLMEHKDEIFSRPARTWFQSGKEKAKSAASSKLEYQDSFNPSKKQKAVKDVDATKPKRDKFSGLSRRAKRRKLALQEDEGLGDSRAVTAAIRGAKKAAKPSKIGEPERRPSKPEKSKTRKKKLASKVISRKGSVFGQDLGAKAMRSEGVRAKKSDKIGGMGKKIKKGQKTNSKSKR